MRRFALLLLASGLAAGSVRAAESSSKPQAAYLDLQPIGAPAVIRGRLVNYIFVDLRLLLGPGVDAARLADQEPFLRDTLVRAATHTPFNRPDDGVHLDDARLKAEVMKDALAIYGPGRIKGVEIRSETPQRRAGVPGGARD